MSMTLFSLYKSFLDPEDANPTPFHGSESLSEVEVCSGGKIRVVVEGSQSSTTILFPSHCLGREGTYYALSNYFKNLGKNQRGKSLPEHSDIAPFSRLLEGGETAYLLDSIAQPYLQPKGRDTFSKVLWEAFVEG